MSEYLVGIYKEIGKKPDIVKIKNQKEYLEKLLDGEYLTQDYDDYTILYKKNADNLLPNIYVDQYSKIGISLRGKVFAVGKDEKGNLISLNKDQARRCITFFLKKSFNYKNCDEYGRPLPRKKKNKKIFKNNNNSSEESKPKTEENTKVQEKAVQQEQPSIKAVSLGDLGKTLNVKNEDFEKNFKTAKVESKTKENNTSNSSENRKLDTKEQNSTNDTPQVVVKLSDEQTLNMILKITFIILDFVKGALEDSEDDEE